MHTFSLSRRHALVVAGLLLLVVLLAGRLLGRGGGGDAPAAERVERVSAAAPPLVVHVVGAVRRPGLYRLADGSRVADAVARAGGATPKADLALINLAAPAADGLQIVVPRRAPPAAPSSAGPSATAGPVHLNTATVEQLDALPGVGPVTAEKIVEYREKNGAFTTVDDLDAIPGIGPARLEQLRELVAP